VKSRAPPLTAGPMRRHHVGVQRGVDGTTATPSTRAARSGTLVAARTHRGGEPPLDHSGEGCGSPPRDSPSPPGSTNRRAAWLSSRGQSSISSPSPRRHARRPRSHSPVAAFLNVEGLLAS